MRLVCPNCGAQYEVDDRVMPEAGRDVQCSNCGHAWFHTPSNNEKASAANAAEPKIEMPDASPPPPPIEQPVVDVTSALTAGTPSDPEPNFEDEAATSAPRTPTAEPASEPEVEATPEPAPVEPAEDTPAPAIPAAIAATTTARETVSAEVKQILQEEAAQELRAREAEQQSPETQPEPTADIAPAPEKDDLEARIQDLSDKANTDTDETTQDSAAPTTPAAKAPVIEPAVRDTDLRSRDTLPDIEDINSTLDAPDTPDETKIDLGLAEEIPVTSGGGFGRGFRLTLLLAVILVGVYILAPQITDLVPQAQGFMDGYVATGDNVRVTLEGAMQSAIEGMRGLMETASDG